MLLYKNFVIRELSHFYLDYFLWRGGVLLKDLERLRMRLRMATTWKEEACGRFIAAKAAVGWERVEGTARLFEQRRHKGRRDEDEDGADSQRQKRPLGV